MMYVALQVNSFEDRLLVIPASFVEKTPLLITSVRLRGLFLLSLPPFCFLLIMICVSDTIGHLIGLLIYCTCS